MSCLIMIFTNGVHPLLIFVLICIVWFHCVWSHKRSNYTFGASSLAEFIRLALSSTLLRFHLIAHASPKIRARHAKIGRSLLSEMPLKYCTPTS